MFLKVLVTRADILTKCSWRLDSTNSSSARSSSNFEWTNAMWRAKFWAFSPLKKLLLKKLQNLLYTGFICLLTIPTIQYKSFDQSLFKLRIWENSLNIFFGFIFCWLLKRCFHNYSETPKILWLINWPNTNSDCYYVTCNYTRDIAWDPASRWWSPSAPSWSVGLRAPGPDLSDRKSDSSVQLWPEKVIENLF